MSFKTIKGQDKAIAVIKGYLRQSRLAGSYLFVGPAGIGKKLTAMTLAKTINCLGESLDSCDSCASCLKIDKGAHPDVHIIGSDVDEAVKIENIRQMHKEISLRPYEAKRKIFIVDNAHNMTADSANALLKTLEEPPQHNLLILITEKPNLLFKTIISRCQAVKFYPLSPEELRRLLEDDYGTSKHAAHFLAYFCEGRLGEALRLKDTDLLRQKNKTIDEFLFPRREALGFSVTQTKADVRRQLNILAGLIRDIYLIKAGAQETGLINFDRKSELLKLSGRYTFIELDSMFGHLSDSLLYIEQNINVRLLLSNLRAQLCRDRS